MSEDEEILNIDWEQDKGIGEKTQMSRRIDRQKAMTAEAKDRGNLKTTAKKVKNLPPNLRKLRKKIKDVYDTDDEDEEDEVIFHFATENENSSLISALKDDEKKQLAFQKTLDNQKMQQTAGKMEALMMADKMSKQLGLKGLKKKVVQQNVQDVSLNNTMGKAIQQNTALKTKLKTENLSVKETAAMVKGLQKMQQAGFLEGLDQTQSVKAEELVEIGRSNDENKTAKLILEKSGRKEAKKPAKIPKNKEQQKLNDALKKEKLRD